MIEAIKEGKVKSHFSLTPAALEVIERRAPSQNKRGDWMSEALVDYDRILAGVPTVDSEGGTLEQMTQRLAMLERNLSAVYLLLAKPEQSRAVHEVSTRP
jgi:hypothetical protein